MASQLEMVNTLLSDAEAVCTGRAQMTKEYNPEPGDSRGDMLAGRVHHKALMEAVLHYYKTVTIPDVLREMGRTDPVPGPRRAPPQHGRGFARQDRRCSWTSFSRRTPRERTDRHPSVCARVYGVCLQGFKLT